MGREGSGLSYIAIIATADQASQRVIEAQEEDWFRNELGDDGVEWEKPHLTLSIASQYSYLVMLFLSRLIIVCLQDDTRLYLIYSETNNSYYKPEMEIAFA